MNIINLTSQAIFRLTEIKEPEDSARMIFGILANAVGLIPDETWEAMKSSSKEPCNKPDCNCHIIAQEVMKALDVLRTDWQIVSNKRRKLN